MSSIAAASIHLRHGFSLIGIFHRGDKVKAESVRNAFVAQTGDGPEFGKAMLHLPYHEPGC